MGPPKFREMMFSANSKKLIQDSGSKIYQYLPLLSDLCCSSWAHFDLAGLRGTARLDREVPRRKRVCNSISSPGVSGLKTLEAGLLRVLQACAVSHISNGDRKAWQLQRRCYMLFETMLPFPLRRRYFWQSDSLIHGCQVSFREKMAKYISILQHSPAAQLYIHRAYFGLI